ncbi:MAG: hypothetical protein ACQEXE_15365 [Bacillota bacterium]
MKKWMVSAIAYLLVVMGAYYAYSSYSETGAEEVSHTDEAHNNDEKTKDAASEEDSGHDDSHNEHESETSVEGDVQPLIQLENEEIIITLKNNNGEIVSDLEVNHEKLLHLIVVSSDLKEYKHLHPETDEPGIFKVKHDLKPGEYKAFIDIKPKDLAYNVKPVPFVIGEDHGDHEHNSLEPDSNLSKQIGGHSASLALSSFKVNEKIELKFNLNGEVPEQYLGALGHVVILDEKAENYIHVHPLEGNEPLFETEFTNPGIYKIWAEFQFDGEVFVFPYVIEIK